MGHNSHHHAFSPGLSVARVPGILRWMPAPFECGFTPETGVGLSCPFSASPQRCCCGVEIVEEPTEAGRSSHQCACKHTSTTWPPVNSTPGPRRRPNPASPTPHSGPGLELGHTKASPKGPRQYMLCFECFGFGHFSVLRAGAAPPTKQPTYMPSPSPDFMKGLPQRTPLLQPHHRHRHRHRQSR